MKTTVYNTNLLTRMIEGNIKIKISTQSYSSECLKLCYKHEYSATFSIKYHFLLRNLPALHFD